MKREDKNALSRARILNAAMKEFSEKGYEGASLNTAWAEQGLSKGIIYHHFRDKDEIYLLCVKKCFEELTAYLRARGEGREGTPAERIEAYFAARSRFFGKNPLYLGIFCDASYGSPPALSASIGECRREFDALNAAVLTRLLQAAPLRKGLSVEAIVEDFREYMDYYNLRFRGEWRRGLSPEEALKSQEERRHRQLDILLHGVLRGKE